MFEFGDIDSKCAKVGIPSGQAWKNHPYNPNEYIVRTLDAQTENVINYLLLNRNINLAQNPPQKKKQQAIHMTKWRRKKSEKPWTPAAP